MKDSPGCHVEGRMTPSEVRDQIVVCFYKAHRDFLLKRANLTQAEKDKFTETSIREIVRGAFSDAGGDFDNPTKESLFYAIMELAELARQFRDIDVVAKNFLHLLKMIDSL